jgi:arginine/lysine/ornithine decarboxylase
MTTPILSFLEKYKESGALRLHMPGHKGINSLGMESLDITEIKGADSLFDADGIIKESEENAGRLFSSHCFYSAEGSSLSIRAMLYMTALYAKEKGKRPLIMAARNVHRSFVSAAALVDFDIKWLYPEEESTYLSCKITPAGLERAIKEQTELPTALYITSPDYLGNVADVKGLSTICRKYGILLLVDNAHGAYLKFLTPSRHPIDLGADMCCDSAHKTLHALTGSAYLHVSYTAPTFFKEHAKEAMALFASTSPSYLILASLDALNKTLANGFSEKLREFAKEAEELKANLTLHGYELVGDEPMKLTVDAKKYGYTGTALSDILVKRGIVSEFSDPDFLCLMLSSELGEAMLTRLYEALISIPKKEEIKRIFPEFSTPVQRLTPREAVFSQLETVAAEDSFGRVLALSNLSCPPAVPIAVSGELIDKRAIELFKYYGIKKCSVVKE